jgi:hypothetical protein
VPPCSGRGTLGPLNSDAAAVDHATMPGSQQKSLKREKSLHVIVRILGVILPAELDKGERLDR